MNLIKNSAGYATSKAAKTINLWTVCAAARKVYYSQMESGLDIKTKSVNYVIQTSFPDYHMFGRDLSQMAENLLDSKRFNEECQELELNPNDVAQHVIFEGAKAYKAVRDMGVKAIIGRNVKDFNAPLYVDK